MTTSINLFWLWPLSFSTFICVPLLVFFGRFWLHLCVCVSVSFFSRRVEVDLSRKRSPSYYSFFLFLAFFFLQQNPTMRPLMKTKDGVETRPLSCWLEVSIVSVSNSLELKIAILPLNCLPLRRFEKVRQNVRITALIRVWVKEPKLRTLSLVAFSPFLWPLAWFIVQLAWCHLFRIIRQKGFFFFWVHLDKEKPI